MIKVIKSAWSVRFPSSTTGWLGWLDQASWLHQIISRKSWLAEIEIEIALEVTKLNHQITAKLKRFWNQKIGMLRDTQRYFLAIK